MSAVRRLLVAALLLCSAAALRGQTPQPLTLERLGACDLSLLWTGPLPLLDREDTTSLQWVERPEALGYIGSDFKRFRIHITSVARSGSDPLCYLVEGATCAGGNVCPFEGELRIDSLVRCGASDAPDEWGGIRSGWSLRGRYVLREEPDRPGAGVLEGVHTLDIAVDEAGTLYYDTLWLVADGYRNNQWQGTWRSYRTGAVKVCCWGDFRIPQSEGLDVGAGEFIPSDTCLDNGWRSYVGQYADDPDLRRAAREEEARRWWIFTD